MVERRLEVPEVAGPIPALPTRTMSRIEQDLERQAWDYVHALRERGILIGVDQAKREVEAAHRRAGTAICGSYYLRADDHSKARDALLEDSYEASE